MFEDMKEKEYLIIMENPLLKVKRGFTEDVNSNGNEIFCTISTDTENPSLILTEESLITNNTKLHLVKDNNTFININRDNPLVLPLEVKGDTIFIESEKLPAYFIWDIIFTICFILGIGEVQKTNDNYIITLTKNEFNYDFRRFVQLFTAKLTINNNFDNYKNNVKEYIKCTDLIIKPYGTFLDTEELQGLSYELEETPKVIRGVMIDTFNF